MSVMCVMKLLLMGATFSSHLSFLQQTLMSVIFLQQTSIVDRYLKLVGRDLASM